MQHFFLKPQAEIPYRPAGFQTLIRKKIIFTIFLNAFPPLPFFGRHEQFYSKDGLKEREINNG